MLIICSIHYIVQGSDDEDDDESSDSSKENESRSDQNKANENSKLCEQRKEYLLTKINPYNNEATQVMQTYIDYDSAELVARYLASNRPFSQSFDTYLKHVRNYFFTNLYSFLFNCLFYNCR